MKKYHRTFTASLLIAAFALGGMMGAHAQGVQYPNKPIRMIVGFPPGGPTDVVARIVGQKLGDQLGQPVVIDNKPGAGGNIGADMVAKAAPDGYTVLYTSSSITISPWIYAKVNYDTVKDFAPVALTAEMPLVLLVNPSVPAKTAPELVQLIKANPGKFNYGSSSVGAIEHLTAAQFVSMHGLKASHVPYKGSAPALIGIIGGQTQFMVTALNSALPFLKDGRLRALAVSSVERSRVLPDVPTVAEAMKGDFAATAWQGIVAPAGTPREIIEKLNRAINTLLKDPALVQQLADQGVSALGGTSEQFGKSIHKELVRWQQVVKDTGATAE
ncbi:MAG: tripartite tricarboxylate transporter substrate binding protein [Rubrivivax sp.]|nr:tripartite tricarboxylate transporter substrate binding protein [Rubrivivax sp.]MBK7260480.1 tripartite tricarboxylate transporter substrate binding protein [Rubrivivax sp.]MBK8526156.1 tripartite tricarboxylate transporter substrate binding protein [Rubrivivax sp.]